MRAVQFSRFGDPQVLEIIDIPTPAPAAGEVLVRVHAAGVNFFEILMRQDRYAVTPDLPMTPGVEVAGVVEALGDGVTRPGVGTRVAVPLFAVGRGSGYVEYAAVDADCVVPLPDALSFDDAAALMVQGLTALHAIRHSPPKDRTVLVTAAAGGVGSLLLQLARDGGARRVIAIVGSDEKLGVALGLGADFAFNHTLPNWVELVRAAAEGVGADVIYDFVGGAFTNACLDALAPHGEVVFGALGRLTLGSDDMERMFARNQSLKGFALLPLLSPAGVNADLSWLFERVASSKLAVVQGGRFALDQVAEAHRAIESRKTVGKIVLVP